MRRWALASATSGRKSKPNSRDRVSPPLPRLRASPFFFQLLAFELWWPKAEPSKSISDFRNREKADHYRSASPDT